MHSALQVSLPEQVALRLPVAGYGSRGLAYLYDFLLRWVSLFTAVFLLLLLYAFVFQSGDSFMYAVDSITAIGMRQGSAGQGRLLIALLVFAVLIVEFVYPIYFEVECDGVSPGKRIMGLRVVNESGLPITLQQSFLRTLFLIVDMLPLFGIVGLVSTLSTSRSQRIGDIVAGTTVIYDGEQEVVPELRQTAGLNVDLPTRLYWALEQYVSRHGDIDRTARTDLEGALEERIAKEAPAAFLAQRSGFATSADWLKFVYATAHPQRLQEIDDGRSKI